MEQKLNREEIAKWLIIGFLLIAFAIIAVQLRTAQMRLTELQRGTSETMTSQQSQIDSLGLYIEGVKDEMQEGLEAHQAQLDSQQEQLNTQKNVQSNTLKAFVRYQKEQAQQNEEFKEELKNDQREDVELEPQEGNRRFLGRMHHRSVLVATSKLQPMSGQEILVRMVIIRQQDIPVQVITSRQARNYISKVSG